MNDQPTGTAHGYIANKDGYLKRLRRIEGQARGLQRMVTDDEVYLASLVLPDLLQWCQGASADVQALCTSLANWDGKADLESGVGLVHFPQPAHRLG